MYEDNSYKGWAADLNIILPGNKKMYLTFIKFINNIEGLGAGNNRMRIKILLILRELRCQKIYSNTPGVLC